MVLEIRRVVSEGIMTGREKRDFFESDNILFLDWPYRMANIFFKEPDSKLFRLARSVSVKTTQPYYCAKPIIDNM